jgi:hypothetical protein
MTYEKITRVAEPCLAPRKKISLTGFTIAGAAALLVAVAGNVQAIPFTTHDEVGNAAIRSQSLQRGQSDYEMVLALDRGNRNQSLTSPSAFNVLMSTQVQNAGQLLNSTPRVSRPRRRGHNAVTTSTQSNGNNPPPVTLPDGGSTAMMLGGVLYGFVLLEKKLKA